MPTSGELWARVQSAEEEHQAALAHYEAFGILDPSSEWAPEYAEAEHSVGLAWV